MFFVYFAFWVILNGKWTTEIAVFGLVFAAVAYVFSCCFMGFSLKTDARILRRCVHAVRYGWMLLGEIINANLTVMRMILNLEFEPKPQLLKFNSGLKKERHRVVLANSITLTPGTITCVLEEDEFLVHALDESLVEGLDDGVMITRLKEMEADK